MPPLNASELLESLVRQSEPLLDHLGIKKGMQPLVVLTMKSTTCVARSATIGVRSAITSERVPKSVSAYFLVCDRFVTCSCVVADREVEMK